VQRPPRSNSRRVGIGAPRVRRLPHVRAHRTDDRCGSDEQPRVGSDSPRFRAFQSELEQTIGDSRAEVIGRPLLRRRARDTDPALRPGRGGGRTGDRRRRARGRESRSSSWRSPATTRSTTTSTRCPSATSREGELQFGLPARARRPPARVRGGRRRSHPTADGALLDRRRARARRAPVPVVRPLSLHREHAHRHGPRSGSTTRSSARCSSRARWRFSASGTGICRAGSSGSRTSRWRAMQPRSRAPSRRLRRTLGTTRAGLPRPSIPVPVVFSVGALPARPSIQTGGAKRESPTLARRFPFGSRGHAPTRWHLHCPYLKISRSDHLLSVVSQL
jgi:hypothetical protein